MSETPLTTAAALLSYRKELIQGGISHDLADALVQDAARAIISDHGLGVQS